MKTGYKKFKIALIKGDTPSGLNIGNKHSDTKHGYLMYSKDLENIQLDGQMHMNILDNKDNIIGTTDKTLNKPLIPSYFLSFRSFSSVYNMEGVKVMVDGNNLPILKDGYLIIDIGEAEDEITYVDVEMNGLMDIETMSSKVKGLVTGVDSFPISMRVMNDIRYAINRKKIPCFDYKFEVINSIIPVKFYKDIKFKITNFTKEENNWGDIELNLINKDPLF